MPSVTRTNVVGSLGYDGRLKFLSATGAIHSDHRTGWHTADRRSDGDESGYRIPETGTAGGSQSQHLPISEKRIIAGNAHLGERRCAGDKSAASNDLDTRSGEPTKDEDGNSANNPNASYVYKVHVRTEQSQFMVEGVPRPIQSGMTVQADIGPKTRASLRRFVDSIAPGSCPQAEYAKWVRKAAAALLC